MTEEDLSKGEKAITPYWWVIKVDGGLNEKLPGGTQAQAARLREEGHGIEPGKGKRAPKVKDCKQASQELSLWGVRIMITTLLISLMGGEHEYS